MKAAIARRATTDNMRRSIPALKPSETAGNVAPEAFACDAEDEKIYSEVDVVEELADLLNQHQLVTVHGPFH